MPTGSDILKMSYSCDLEKMASKSVKECRDEVADRSLPGVENTFKVKKSKIMKKSQALSYVRSSLIH
ncbi:unnamed protein product [Strongylus vulgaris]|uniref:Uncharacterized protein n=1 Tax=Strongylus vulgaris TaxID=40348 RepID=A0A3P7JUP3_STRVU|nr:unnamed protein product [Strongylus vulgaris]